jgi:hypothetical protein
MENLLKSKGKEASASEIKKMFGMVQGREIFHDSAIAHVHSLTRIL